jgi:hypothetical protein
MIALSHREPVRLPVPVMGKSLSFLDYNSETLIAFCTTTSQE